jgi:hypothetical protein
VGKLSYSQQDSLIEALQLNDDHKEAIHNIFHCIKTSPSEPIMEPRKTQTNFDFATSTGKISEPSKVIPKFNKQHGGLWTNIQSSMKNRIDLMSIDSQESCLKP